MTLVSCIMPTCDRRKFAKQAIWYFLRQNYEHRELIVVDDGNDRINDLIPKDNRIKYVSLNQPATLSYKLNLACEMSSGEFIAHWEDDDWMSPFRLQVQVDYLIRSNRNATCPTKILYYMANKGESWVCSVRDIASSRLLCGPVLYRRQLWLDNAFDESEQWPSSPFPPGTSIDQIHAEPDSDYYLKVHHAECTVPINLRDSVWQQAPLVTSIERTANDHKFYDTLRNHSQIQGAELACDKQQYERITVAAPFMVYDGYGSVAQYIVLGMLRAGAYIDIAPFRLDCNGMTEEFKVALNKSCPHPESPSLCFTWPRENLSWFENSRDRFLYTMWETSKLPLGWSDVINSARAVFVPTNFVANVFKESGVRIPIVVVSQGVDPDVYCYIDRPRRESLTTLMVGTFVPRKNFEIGIEAWKRAFPHDPNARLLIKSRFRVTRYVPDDPRIIFTDNEETSHGIVHWYKRADVFLALGNEGFGLPLVEGMATGLPVIALNSEGQSDVCREAGDCLLPVSASRWAPFIQEPFGYSGVRAIPSVEEVANHLQWVSTHREEANKMGIAASAWATKNRNLWDVGPRLLHHMERLASPPRRFRSV